MTLHRTYLLALAALALAVTAGCGKEDVADSRLIRFSPSVHSSVPATKADPNLPDDEEYLMADGNKIGVFGTWKSPEGVSTDVFSNIEVTCQDNGASASPRYLWDYSPHKYWRKGGKYFFHSVYPYTANTQYGTDGTRMVVTYSMFSDNYDLMVAGAERDMAGDDTSPVNLDFKHACAAVRVVFRKGSEDANRHYLLNSFKMQYLHALGVLVCDDVDVTLASWSPAEYRSPSVMEWTAENEAARIDVPESFEDYKLMDTGTLPKWHFAVPQNLNTEDNFHPSLQFSVYVKQYQEDGITLSYSTATPVYTTLPLPETYEDAQHNVHDVVWEPGKVYTYYVQIQAGQASITVSVTDWDRYYVYIDDMIFG